MSDTPIIQGRRVSPERAAPVVVADLGVDYPVADPLAGHAVRPVPPIQDTSRCPGPPCC